MSKYKIEKGIPLPVRVHPRYPFREMKVGDSFFIPGARQGPVASAASAFVRFNQKGWKFATSGQTGRKGVRVWRIK